MFLESILIDTKPPAKNLSSRTPEEILKDFSRRDLGKTCLAHLFTFSPDPKGVLGYTWPAYLAPGKEGGICTDLFYPPSGPPMRVNTGYTSFANENGQMLVPAAAILITAHELGHSWGALHDPEGDECTPSAAKGGQYLMFPQPVSGYSPNNYNFSSCSRRSIGAVLERRSSRCFVEKYHTSSGLCGNNCVDPDEDCDAGRSGASKCCLKTCKLAPRAECSPSNDQCCTKDCRLAARGTACNQGVAETSLRYAECSKSYRHCPTGQFNLAKPCYEHGFCSFDDCKPFCSLFSLKTCICDKAEFSCLICCVIPLRINDEKIKVCRPILIHNSDKCRKEMYGTYSPSPKGWVAIPIKDSRRTGFCWPLESEKGWPRPRRFNSDLFYLWNKTNEKPRNDLSVMHLDNNRPCPYGVCRSGVCQESKARSTNQLGAIVEQVVDYKKVRYIWANFWANIVVIILCLAVVIWVPLSILVNSYDVQLEESRRYLETLFIFNKYKPPAIVLQPLKRTRRRTL